ncbi:hypothetical protein BC628DRAFT_1195904 [Trametes gibbosa]|nr:hypothetical protein BC628DRAFT_1195904 [Trametes gibbosa]
MSHSSHSMSHNAQGTPLILYSSTAAVHPMYPEWEPLPVNSGMSAMLDTEDQVMAFAAFLREDTPRRARLIQRLVLRFNHMTHGNINTFVWVIRQLSCLTALWFTETEWVLRLCPPLEEHIAELRCLRCVRFGNAGEIAYRVLARMRTQLVSLVMLDFPGSTITRCATPTQLLSHSVSTLTTIEMPNVSLDLRARTERFPRVRALHIAYDRVALLELGAYRQAFPYLQRLKVTATPPLPDHLALNAVRGWNQSEGRQQPRLWERLERVEMPACDLWMLGLCMPIDTLVLRVNPGFPVAFLSELVGDLRPRHLRTHFHTTEDASMAARNFDTVFGASSRGTRLSTFAIEAPLPLEVPRLMLLLVCPMAASSWCALVLMTLCAPSSPWLTM